MGIATRIPAGKMISAMERTAASTRFTAEQAEIIEASAGLGSSGTGPAGGAGRKAGQVLKVIAFAGAGKTTTLGGVARLRSSLPGRASRGLYLAFNRAIAKEAGPKFRPFGCRAATMHSLAWTAAGQPRELGRLDGRLVAARGLTPQIDATDWTQFRLSAAVARTVRAFCASADRSIGIEHARRAILDVDPDPDRIRDPGMREEAIAGMDRLLEPIAASAALLFDEFAAGNIALDHDIYLKFLDLSSGLRAAAFDGAGYLMVDEAQDLNPVQRSIVEKTGLPLVAVGDPFQQIYGWRGAENALQLLPDNYQTLYLTQSFRFGEEIAAPARAILESRPDGGPAQVLSGMRTGPAMTDGPRDAILCRTNIGVVREAMGALVEGRKVHLAVNIDELVQDVESANALRTGRRGDIRSPEIRAFSCWEDLVEEARSGDRALAIVVSFIENGEDDILRELRSRALPEEAGADVVVSTAHKAKGREWPNVRLGDDWAPLSARKARHAAARKKGDKHAASVLEEWNALYVAATRAMETLSFDEDLVANEEDIDRGRVRAPIDLDRTRCGEPGMKHGLLDEYRPSRNMEAAVGAATVGPAAERTAVARQAPAREAAQGIRHKPRRDVSRRRPGKPVPDLF